MRTTNTHIYFWGSFLSNFWLAPTTLEINGENTTFLSSEHAFMALKALTFNDLEAYEDIKKAPEARFAKAVGRRVKGLKGGKWDAEDIQHWADKSYEAMVMAVYAKFSQNILLREALLDTGNKIIVEASPEDQIWGVGLHESDDAILDERNWRGTNWLGKALMEVRERLINEVIEVANGKVETLEDMNDESVDDGSILS